MSDTPSADAGPEVDSHGKAEPRRSGFVQISPGPETPEVPDRTGRRRGMALVLAGSGVFWAFVGAAVWALMRG